MYHTDTPNLNHTNVGFFFFLILSIFLLPVAHVKSTVFGIPVYFPEWAVLGALGALILHAFRTKKWNSVGYRDTLLFAGITLFLAGALLSFLANPLSLTGLGLLKSWFFLPFLFGLMITIRLDSNPQERQVFFLSWFLMLTLVAIRSLWFYHTGELTYDHRLRGDYTSPNFLAYFLAPAPLIGYYLFTIKGNQQRKLLEHILFLGCIAVVLMALYLTRSYSVWIALLVSALVLFWGSHKTSKVTFQRLSMLILPIVLIGVFFWSDQGTAKWHDLISGDARSSLSSRVMIWQSATRILEDHIALGIGVGRFQEEYLSYQSFFSPYLEWAVPEPHNFLLALFLSTGLLGGIGFVFVSIRLVLLFVKRLYGDQELNYEGFFLFSLWLLFFVYGLVDTPYFKTDLAYAFFLLFALSKSYLFEKKTPRGEGA